MAITLKMWSFLLLAWVVAATATNSHQTIESSFFSGQPTRAVVSGTIVDEATLITRLSIETTTSSIASNSTNIAEIAPETVEGRTATELDPSLQIVFLVLGTLFALASVVVAVVFGYKQLSIAKNQSNAERNHVDVDIELGDLNGVSDEAHTTADLATRNSLSVNEDLVRTLETAIVHLSNALAFRLVAVWSFVRHAGQGSPLDLAPPSGRLGEPPNNAGHEQHIHSGTAHV
jgi:hypothetical protein